MIRLGYRYQRTLARSAEVSGTGFITGASVRLRFMPAAPSTGVVFLRTDLKGKPTVAARAENVTGTSRRTTIGKAPCQVELIEHVMAALAALRIDNCRIELNGQEPPGLDGSSYEYIRSLLRAGTVLQTYRKEIWTVSEPIRVSEGEASLAIHPGPLDQLRLSYLLDYGDDSPIIPQRFTQTLSPEEFRRETASCRTFLLKEEAEQLQLQGIGRHHNVHDVLVFGPFGPIENSLRFGNEPARHKVLDMAGDLALFGNDLRGHVVGYRSGHSLNVALAKKLTQEISARRTLKVAA